MLTNYYVIMNRYSKYGGNDDGASWPSDGGSMWREVAANMAKKRRREDNEARETNELPVREEQEA